MSHLPTPFPAREHRDSRRARSSVPAELSVCLTARGKPRQAYLEDRGQVLSHFQCLSLHCVYHILHPGAGIAAGPATGWEGQPEHATRSQKMSPLPPTCFGTPATALDGTGRTGRGGGAAGAAREDRARGPRAPGSERRTGASCQLAAREGDRDKGWVGGGEERAHAHPWPSGTIHPSAPLASLPASPSFSHSLAVAPPPLGPHVT